MSTADPFEQAVRDFRKNTLSDLAQHIIRHPEIGKAPIAMFVEGCLDYCDYDLSPRKGPDLTIGRILQRSLDHRPRSKREIVRCLPELRDQCPSAINDAFRLLRREGEIRLVGYGRSARWVKDTPESRWLQGLNLNAKAMFKAYVRSRGSTKRTAKASGYAVRTVRRYLLKARRLFGVRTNKDLIPILKEMFA